MLWFLGSSVVGSSPFPLVRPLILDLISSRRSDLALLRIAWAFSCAFWIGSVGLAHSSLPLLSSGRWCRSNSMIAASCFCVRQSATSLSYIYIWTHSWFHSYSKARRLLSVPQPISKEQDDDPSDSVILAALCIAFIWFLLDVIYSCRTWRFFDSVAHLSAASFERSLIARFSLANWSAKLSVGLSPVCVFPSASTVCAKTARISWSWGFSVLVLLFCVLYISSCCICDSYSLVSTVGGCITHCVVFLEDVLSINGFLTVAWDISCPLFIPLCSDPWLPTEWLPGPDRASLS